MGEHGKDRSGWLHIRTTPELARSATEAADGAGLTTSEWARRAVVRALAEGGAGMGEEPGESGEPAGNVADLLASVERLLRHIEPLAYVAAVDSAYEAEGRRWQLLANAKGDRAKFDEINATMRDRAVARVQRALRHEEETADGNAD